MKKVAIFLGIAAGAAVLAFFASRDKKAVIGDFSWSINGKTAPYSFSISNQTDKTMEVVVVLKAHNVTEGKDGTKLRPFGLSNVVVILAGREEKKVSGVLELLDFGSSATKVSFRASLK